MSAKLTREIGSQRSIVLCAWCYQLDARLNTVPEVTDSNMKGDGYSKKCPKGRYTSHCFLRNSLIPSIQSGVSTFSTDQRRMLKARVGGSSVSTSSCLRSHFSLIFFPRRWLELQYCLSYRESTQLSYPIFIYLTYSEMGTE